MELIVLLIVVIIAGNSVGSLSVNISPWL